MPKLWKFLSRSDAERPQIDSYEFTAAEDILPDEPPEPPPPEEEEAAPAQQVEETEEEREARIAAEQEEMREKDPLSFARIQSRQLLEDARLRAEELERLAEMRIGKAVEAGRKEGFAQGLQEGIAQGNAQALEQAAIAREEMCREMQRQIDEFLKRADGAIDRHLADYMDDLRDLALAVAEKVVCVSLKSSTEVVGKMIQTAVDKRRRREWVRIYIAECDAKHLATASPALTAALSELSDRVRIVPLADDEPGTCIVECPDEIIDASASTQMQNIREMLRSRGTAGGTQSFTISERGMLGRVPPNDTPGL